MTAPAKKKIQLRISEPLYRRARTAVDQGIEEIPSFNDFVVKAVKEKLRRIEEARIDAAFMRMGSDKKYLAATKSVFDDFSDSDWNTLNMSEK